MLYFYSSRKLVNNKNLKMLSLYLFSFYVMFSNLKPFIEFGKK